MAENRRIPNIRNILECSRINWRVMVRIDFHIRYSPIFVFSENLEVPRIYLTHNVEYREYTNTLIHTFLVPLFSTNILSYSPKIYGCAVPPLCQSGFRLFQWQTECVIFSAKLKIASCITCAFPHLKDELKIQRSWVRSCFANRKVQKGNELPFFLKSPCMNIVNVH